MGGHCLDLLEMLGPCVASHVPARSTVHGYAFPRIPPAATVQFENGWLGAWWIRSSAYR